MGLQSKNTSREIMSDEKIIELYWARDERAINETDFKYRRYLRTVAYNIVRDRQDSEECLNDTYLGAWNSIPPSRPRVLKAFLTVIMRRIAINRYHSNSKKGVVPSEMTVSLSELENCLSEVSGDDRQVSAEYLGHVISDFLRSLNERRRFIFMSRYYMAEPIDSIARELGVSRSTVNKELAAIRDLLWKKLESEGIKI